MSEAQSGSLLAPLIFVICLAILPGAGGFFLAIFVLIAINVIVNERRRREDSSPMPDTRVLKLFDPRPAVQDRAEAKEQSAEIPSGDEVYKLQEKHEKEQVSLATADSRETSEFKTGTLATNLSPKTTTTVDHSGTRNRAADEFSRTLVRSIGPYIFPVLTLAFLVLLAKSETLFYIFAFLFWATIITAIGALIVLALGNWPGLSIGASILALYLTGSVIFTDQPSAELVLGTSVAWLVTCLLVRLLLKKRKKESILLFILAKNGTEFTMVFAAAAAVALMLPGVFSHVPLARVLSWREHLNTVRKLLGKVALKSGTTLALVFGVFILRRAFSRWRWSVKLEPLWKAWDAGSDWLKRIGFALTAVFCFSFIGNLQGNVIDSLQTKIRELDKTYDNLVWQVYLDFSAELNIHAYETAWEQLPTEGKQTIQREIDLNQAAESVPPMYFRAKTPPEIYKDLFFDDPQKYLEKQKERTEGNLLRILPDYPPQMPDAFLKFQAPPQTSYESVAEAVADTEKTKNARSTPKWMQGLGWEVADKYLEFLLDSEHVEFIKKLSDRYPALSELLDVVSKSVQEKISGRLEESAKRIAEKRMEGPTLSVAGLIKNEMASYSVEIDSPHTASRIEAKGSAQRDYLKMVNAANNRFMSDLRIERDKELAEMHLAEKSLRKVASIVGSEVRIESEEDVRDVSVRSIEIIKERTRSYEVQQIRIVRGATPLAQAQLIGILGTTAYQRIVNSPIEDKPEPWEAPLPHEPVSPGYRIPADHVDRPPEEAPHYETPPL
jgi:hypothetical protein